MRSDDVETGFTTDAERFRLANRQVAEAMARVQRQMSDAFLGMARRMEEARALAISFNRAYAQLIEQEHTST